MVPGHACIVPAFIRMHSITRFIKGITMKNADLKPTTTDAGIPVSSSTLKSQKFKHIPSWQ
jgi:hypothetical protein